MDPYRHHVHFWGFTVSRHTGSMPSTERRRSFLNEQCPRWYCHQSSSDFSLYTDICSSSSLTSTAGDVSVSGVMPVRFSSFGMAISMLPSQDLGLNMAFSPCL